MNKRFLGLVIVIFMMVFSISNEGFSQIIQESAKGYGLNFFYDYASFKGNDGKSELQFYYQIANDVVTFVKSDEGFSGSYDLSVSFYETESNRLVTYKSWEEKLNVKEYNETKLSSEFWINQMNFEIEPGEYKMSLILTDKESGHENKFEDEIVVDDYLKSGKILMSDIELIGAKINHKKNPRFVKDKDLILVPNATTVFGDLIPRLDIYYELYNLPKDSDDDGKLNVEYRILNYRSEIIFSFFEDIEFNSESTSQYAAIPITDIPEGKFYLEVRIRADKKERFFSKNKRFFIKRSFGPVGADFEKSLKYMRYIASEEEMNKIAGAPDTEKKKLWLEFWKSKDPTPGSDQNEFMTEYYRRIRYANEKFSHTKEGWLTDRGRIYIQLGTPDEIEKNEMYGANQISDRAGAFRDNIGALDDKIFFDETSRMLHGAKPCEIWYYYNMKKKFTFIDKHGTGNFVLLNLRADW